LQNPSFLSIQLVIALHQDLIEEFGGALGIRDKNLLESALAQPQATFGGEYLHSTIYEQAAAYLYYIAKDHAFIEGNKRAAVAALETFLVQNKYWLTLSNDQLLELASQVVSSEIDRQALCGVLKENIQPFP
jgi:death on curing protein